MNNTLVIKCNTGQNDNSKFFIIKMFEMWMIINFLFTLLHIYSGHEVVVAYNCGSHTNVSSKYVKYISDEMYEGLTSRMALKPSIPASIIDEQDKKLLISERVTDYDAFSYYFKISSRDHYLLIFKFIEVIHKSKEERVFNIKIGDEVIHKVDIFAEAGYGNILHKWTTFNLRQDIVYLNKTYPALNAYIYTKRLLKVTFEKVKGTPKIDALILVKGDDVQKFLNDYISYEQNKNLIVREYVSEKYHIVPKNHFKKMRNRLDFIVPEESLVGKLFRKYFWKALVSALAVLFLIFHQEIYNRMPLSGKKNEETRNEFGTKFKGKHD